jgi:hypothetical protein
MEPDNLLCSRNARSQKTLVGRAQWKINQAPSLKIEQASLEGSFYMLVRWAQLDQHGCLSKREKERIRAQSRIDQGCPFENIEGIGRCAWWKINRASIPEDNERTW